MSGVTISGFPGAQISYAYDGAGQRVQRSTYGLTSTYIYDAGGAPISEYRNGAWLKDFVYLNGRLLAVEDAHLGRSYVTPDHLGSTRVVTNSSASVISRHDYLPFGKEVPTSFGGRGSIAAYGAEEHVLQRFTGQETDPETGLDYFGARYYSGRQGRFTSPDPANAGASPLDPQSWNGYSYVLNNPLLYVDPTGAVDELGSGSCTIDGVTASCSLASRLLQSGAAFLDNAFYRWNFQTGTLQQWVAQGTSGQAFLQGDRWVLPTTTTQGWQSVDWTTEEFSSWEIFDLPTAANNNSWWGTFAKTFFTKPYRRSGETFVTCWNRATEDTTSTLGVPADYELGGEALAAASGAVGLFESIKSIRWSSFGGRAWVRPSSVAAVRLGLGSNGVKMFRWAGKGLAALGAAEAGLRTGTALDCAIPD